MNVSNFRVSVITINVIRNPWKDYAKLTSKSATESNLGFYNYRDEEEEDRKKLMVNYGFGDTLRVDLSRIVNQWKKKERNHH